MKEFIAREKFLKECMKTFGSMGVTIKAIEGIANECTADVVEVVRCKDCVYWDGPGYKGLCEAPMNGLVREYTDDDSFCSYGERKDAE